MDHLTISNFLNNLFARIIFSFNNVTGNVGGVIALQPAIKFNGGGHINHSIFWNNLSPNGGGGPQGKPFNILFKPKTQIRIAQRKWIPWN